MDKKQFFLGMVLASMIGGVVAIGAYTLIGGNQSQLVNPQNAENIRFTDYKIDTTDFIVPEGLNFVYAAKTVTPAVVHIRTRIQSPNGMARRSPFGDWLEDYFGERGNPRGPGGPGGMGAGSGVIVSEDGYIVTNNHVIDEASSIEVLLNDNRTFEAELVGTDPTTDLAVIKIDAKQLPTLSFGNSDKIQIGEWVLAVGNPFEFRSTVTAGIVSAKARNIGILRNRNNLQIESFIQTDAAVNPGNSGGALVNLRGELVGINTAIATPTGTFAGYSFAVPTTLVKKVVDDLIEFGVVQRALLGINITDVNAELAEREDLPVVSGVYVANVNDNSAAFDAGLESGDVIIAIDGREVKNVSQLQELIAINRPGDKVNVEYIRDGKRRTVVATLKNTLGTTEIVENKNSATIEGAVFEEVSEDEIKNLPVDGGVRITEISGGKFADAGIKEGFIITSIDKNEIRTVEDLTTTLQRLSRGSGILIEGIYPNGDKAYYGVGW